MLAYRRSVPTAIAGLMPQNRIRIGVISEPPPTPVAPTAVPTTRPARIKPSSCMSYYLDEMSCDVRIAREPTIIFATLCIGTINDAAPVELNLRRDQTEPQRHR